MMNKNTLIILVLVGLAIYLCYTNVYEGFSQNIRLSNIFGAHSSRTKYDELYEIGNDADNQPVYKYKDNTFKLKEDDNTFESYEPKKINYFPVAVRIPHVITSKSIKSIVPMKIEDFKFRGLLANTYYKQYFSLYEKEYTNYDREDKLYEYLLVKKIENDFKVTHRVPPRSKIVLGDTVYFSYGNFQLGPLKFI
jgi:hypothetical protein